MEQKITDCAKANNFYWKSPRNRKGNGSTGDERTLSGAPISAATKQATETPNVPKQTINIDMLSKQWTMLKGVMN